ncbi:MAG: dihydroorotate dehydrogenase electron transfer subunit [Firmicutes bacterium]|nr:dihydroorotate dehydrogenase electron transfer subunit [Bacillota bacterium]MDY6159959.1 dihydroorotate dehydrogenase electron transfer subunit [Candidatus Faecousia sp.]
MKQVIFEISSNQALTRDVYRMVLRGDTSGITNPGQFVEIALPGKFLRRPISVNDWDADSLALIYKVVGQGTEQMAQLPVGTKLDVLTGLGNGYDTARSGDKPVLVGGGVGVPPLYALCKKLLAEGKHPSVVLGFNKESEIFLKEKFEALGVPVSIATADGSVGTKGFVTDVLRGLDYSYFYACGPMPMFRAMEQVVKTSGEYSFEERMGCGFGACMGCSIQTKSGAKRVCKDGPVFIREEVFG